ncbi:MAG TPA: hypothetical protein VFB34_12015 [Chloroflexota bacterium]|nr:hypothetical protein [Chloroflexota bacterium]
MLAEVEGGRLTSEAARARTGALLGLLAVCVLVGVLVYTNLALAGAGVAMALLLVLLALRHPSAIAYVALTWLVFEKAVGYHVGSYSNTLSTAGDGLLVLSLFWVLVLNLMRRHRPLFSLREIGAPVLAFVALGIVSTLVNAVPLRIAGLGILSTIHAMLIFLALVNIGLQARDVRRFAFVVSGLIALVSIIAVLQAIPHSPAWALGGVHFTTTAGIMRVTGPFDNPNSLGDYLAMTVPIPLMLLFFGRTTGSARKLVAVAAGLGLLAILLTFAREAWLGLPVATLIVGLAVDRRLLKAFVTYVVPALVVLLLLAAPFASRLLETTHGNLRLTLLKLSMPLILSHVWLGVGPGRFGGHVALITHTPLYAQYGLTQYFYGTGNQIDMFWTHLVAESGILGSAAFLAAIVACFISGRRAYLRTFDPRRRALLLGLLYAAPVGVFVSLVSPTLEAGPGATLFWALMGMLVVLAASPDESHPLRRPSPVSHG